MLDPQYRWADAQPEGRVKILVIEDDPETMAYIENVLAEEGHLVARAASGDDGLFQALGDRFDLLIIDRMLPTLDGLSLVKEAARLRQSNACSLPYRARRRWRPGHGTELWRRHSRQHSFWEERGNRDGAFVYVDRCIGEFRLEADSRRIDDVQRHKAGEA